MICTTIAQIKQDIQTIVAQSQQTTPVKLIAVSKRKPLSAIQEALACGQVDFGENYVQEAVEKIINLQDSGGVFHFIGPLQSNKAKLAVSHFDVIHTIDRLKIAKAVSKQAVAQSTTQKILIQVNVGMEKQKSGVLPDQAVDLLEAIHALPALEICGLMTIPPYNTDPEASRPYFSTLRKLGLSLQQKGLLALTSPLELSMGMSSDYKIAIEEGATLIRVGTAIFGLRD